jgi:hypothetical protein
MGSGAAIFMLLRRGDSTAAAFLSALLVATLALPQVLGPLLRALIRAVLRFVSSFARRGREIGEPGLLIAGPGIGPEFYQVGQLVESRVGVEGTTVPAMIVVLGWSLVLCVALGVLGSLLCHRFPALGEFVRRHWRDRDA